MILPKITELFNLDFSLAGEFLSQYENACEALPKINEFITDIQKKLAKDEYDEVEDGVFIAKDARISDNAIILAPTIVGHKSEVRQGAFLRGSCIIGNGTVIGNSTEIKNSIIFDSAELPHYNYVGDSIIGYKAHLGAGAIVSNLRLDKKNVTITSKNERFETGLRKFGALIADFCEIGCNSVICPGTVIGRHSAVYPLITVKGIIPSNSIIKE